MTAFTRPAVPVALPGDDDFSPHRFLDVLLKANVFDDYMLYASDRELRIAGGAMLRIRVTGDEMVIDGPDIAPRSVPVTDPFKQAEAELARLAADDWVAYGYVSFDAAGFYYPYPRGRDFPVLELIVPEIELRFSETGISTRGPIDKNWLLTVAGRAGAGVSQRLPGTCSIQPRDQNQYESNVAQLTDAIRGGALQKAIMSRRVELKGSLDVVQTYAAASVNTAARSYCFGFGDVSGVGFSPELLLEADGSGRVLTGPLAGTRPRGATAAADASLRAELHNDAKEIKEHALSIFMAQEELKEVCVPETVRITDFMNIKSFRTVQHLASQVLGQLRSDQTVWDALKVLFPGITVSGIPKREALQKIGELESGSRGIYAGVVGWIDSTGAADLAIAIRSVFQYGNDVHVTAGAGIVAESEPEREYVETANKMNTMLQQIVLAA